MIQINKKAQEEMVGFAFIVIITAVILIVFLSIAFGGKGDDGIESFKVNSFLQSTLTQTTNCFDGIKYLSIKQLIFDCSDLERCDDSRITCDVLKEYLTDITNLSWNTGSDTLGYTLNVGMNDEFLIPEIAYGNTTRNYRGSSQSFSKGGNSYYIEFKVHN